MQVVNVAVLELKRAKVWTESQDIIIILMVYFLFILGDSQKMVKKEGENNEPATGDKMETEAK